MIKKTVLFNIGTCVCVCVCVCVWRRRENENKVKLGRCVCGAQESYGGALE